MTTASSSTADIAIMVHILSDHHLRVEVAGEVDLATCRQLDATLGTLFAHHTPKVIEVDLDEVSFLDSSGILVLVHRHTHARERGCRLVVSRPRRTVRRVLEITGVLAVLCPDD